MTNFAGFSDLTPPDALWKDWANAFSFAARRAAQQAAERLGGSGVMNETTAVAFPKIRDGEDQPTCLYREKVCPFYMQSDFGAREHCYWLRGKGKYRTQLERRDHGKGTTLPHEQCPIWEGPQPPYQPAETELVIAEVVRLSKKYPAYVAAALELIRRALEQASEAQP